jgi:spore coat polysaccharide biosynthesis protein SpsF
MIVAVIQARMGSTRLPGKVLEPILGEPMLLHMIRRVQRTPGIERIVVATSDSAEDNSIEALAAKCGVGCFRGAEEDVLDRIYHAASLHQPEHVMRLTADCPLYDPMLAAAVVGLHLDQGNDHTSNCHPPTFPDGLDVEVIRFEGLEQAWREASGVKEREHVTLFLVQNAERFRLGCLRSGEDLSGMRWTVDHADDLRFVRAVFERLYPVRPDFGWRDVLALVRQEPELAERKADHRRNEALSQGPKDGGIPE